MVFCGLYPVEGDDFADFREALDKLIIDDGSFSFEPETSGALGFGFRCGFLGLLHMEIVRERLEREFDLALIATAPSVEYRVETNGGEVIEVDNPSDLPPAGEIEAIQEPWLTASLITPASYTGTLIELCESRRGSQQRIDYLSPGAGGDRLPAPAGRGRHRLLRPAQEPQPGLRQPRLRERRLRGVQPGEGRRPPQRRARSTPSARSCTGTAPMTTARRSWPSCGS